MRHLSNLVEWQPPRPDRPLAKVHVGVHHGAIGIRVAVLEQHRVVGDSRSQIHIEMLPQIVPGHLGAVVGVKDHLGPVLDGEEVAGRLADVGAVGEEVDGAVAELRLQLEGEEDGALELPPGGRVGVADGEELPALDARERGQRYLYTNSIRSGSPMDISRITFMKSISLITFTGKTAGA